VLTAEDVRAYVSASTADLQFCESCLTSADALCVKYVGTQTDVDEAVWDKAVIQVASELFHRRQAPGGVSQFSSMDGAPVFVGNDPMRSVYSLLDRYRPRGI
jgi:hypothetical protein